MSLITIADLVSDIPATFNATAEDEATAILITLRLSQLVQSNASGLWASGRKIIDADEMTSSVPSNDFTIKLHKNKNNRLTLLR